MFLENNHEDDIFNVEDFDEKTVSLAIGVIHLHSKCRIIPNIKTYRVLEKILPFYIKYGFRSMILKCAKHVSNGVVTAKLLNILHCNCPTSVYEKCCTSMIKNGTTTDFKNLDDEQHACLVNYWRKSHTRNLS